MITSIAWKREAKGALWARTILIDDTDITIIRDIHGRVIFGSAIRGEFNQKEKTRLIYIIRADVIEDNT